MPAGIEIRVAHEAQRSRQGTGEEQASRGEAVLKVFKEAEVRACVC
jgi:hypothetical protein